MDPLSISAALVTFLAAAGKTCEALHVLFCGIEEAQTEMKDLLLALKALNTALTNLQKLMMILPPILEIVSDLHPRTNDCLGDLRAIESKIRGRWGIAESGTLRRGWSSLRWSFSKHRWLGRFHSRVQLYNQSFCLDLLCLQMLVTSRLSCFTN